MPIKIPCGLPAETTLKEENISIWTERCACAQSSRVLRILLLNIMPKKIETETQFARLLGNTPFPVELTLLRTATHQSKNISKEHLLTFYKTFEEIETEYFDGLIITGAPVEHMPFEEVEYWQELCKIMQWSKTHAKNTLHICWGAQAGLYYHYSIEKYPVPYKLFGIFPHEIHEKNSSLFHGFGDSFLVPQSRHTTVRKEDIEKVNDLQILASSKQTGVHAIATKDGKQIFITGHSEYDADTLKNEYLRDLSQGKEIQMPVNYFPENNAENPPLLTWREPAQLFFKNWLEYFVAKNQPYITE